MGIPTRLIKFIGELTFCTAGVFVVGYPGVCNHEVLRADCAQTRSTWQSRCVLRVCVGIGVMWRAYHLAQILGTVNLNIHFERDDDEPASVSRTLSARHSPSPSTFKKVGSASGTILAHAASVVVGSGTVQDSKSAIAPQKVCCWSYTLASSCGMHSPSP